MNQQLKTVLLTVLTLSLFVIALVELSGVSKTALLNKFNANENGPSAAANIENLPKTTIEFAETKHSFGTITEGDKVTHAFKFKNTGSNPLVISNAIASCGCTVPSYPKEPVPPGGEGELVVQFNSSGREGHQQKNVMVYSNGQQEAMSIGFDADVKAK
ncbi:MAG TPA: DUF1573 domain-containing protein [Flavipsychrobacter sp.]|jgi:hypothetical protein|nr:DUF1573 domain-containing protein [Flavipsychrobacter sp.]